MSAGPTKKRIGEMLLEAGIIDETQLKAALGHQRQWGVRLGQALVDLKLATEADIVRALSLKFGFEVAKIDTLEPYGHEQALKLLPRDFTVRNNVFPMWADTANVTVAMSDPTNLSVVDEIRFRTSRRVKVCIGGDREIAEAVKRHYPGDKNEVQAIPLDVSLARVVPPDDLGDLAVAPDADLHAAPGAEPDLVHHREVRGIAHRHGDVGGVGPHREDVVADGELARQQLQRLLERVGLERVHLRHVEAELHRERADDVRLGGELQVDEGLAEPHPPLPLVSQRSLELRLVDDARFQQHLADALLRRSCRGHRYRAILPPLYEWGRVTAVTVHRQPGSRWPDG